MQRVQYLTFRSRFQPTQLKLVMVGESPPASGKYFYNPDGAVTEPLFSAVMQQIDMKPASKQLGLRALQDRGWLLVDATYEPVNEYTDTKKDGVIVRDYPHLRDDLRRMDPTQSVPVVLIKVNVYHLLNERLSTDGFNVLNRGDPIPFPSNGQQNRFKGKFAEIVRKAGV